MCDSSMSQFYILTTEVYNFAKAVDCKSTIMQVATFVLCKCFTVNRFEDLGFVRCLKINDLPLLLKLMVCFKPGDL